MLVGQWFAPGKTPMHATSSTRWRATSYGWTEASPTPGMTSKSLCMWGKSWRLVLFVALAFLTCVVLLKQEGP